MATPELPQGQTPSHTDESNLPSAHIPERSRLEETLVKSSIWKKQTLHDIGHGRAPATSEPADSDTRTARLLARLSEQLDERNEEIDRLRRAVAKLEDEKSELGRTHRQELEQRQTELEILQQAYDQFEMESDSLLAELSQQNEQLLVECRHYNVRSLLKQ